MGIEPPEQSSITQPLSEEAVDPAPEPLAKPQVSDTKTPIYKSRKFLLPAGLLLAVLLVGGLGWQLVGRLFGSAGPAQQGPGALPVKTAKVKSAVVSDSSDYVANLQSRQSVTLQPRVSGQVSDIYVRAGDRVEAGKAVLQIDPAEQQAAVSNRLAAVQTSQAEIEVARTEVTSARNVLQSLQAQRQARLADVRLNQQEFQRFRDLFNQGATSQQVLDQRLNSLQLAQASLAQIEADIQAQQAAIARAESNIVRNQRSRDQATANVAEQQAQLDYHTITAPFSGTVGDIPIKVGDFVSTTTPLMNITQNSELEIQVSVPIENAPKLRKGLAVQLLDANNQPLQTGRVFFISPNVDPQTQSVLVKAVFENAGGKLRTAQFVRARLIWSQRPDGLLVPITAIARLAGQNFVFVAEPYAATCKADAEKQGTKPTLEDDQLVASQRPIKLGKVIGNDQEVLEGLAPNTEIVIDSILLLRNCAPIMSQPPGTPSGQPTKG